MNYYVDIHANILPGMPALAGGTLTPEQAAERLAFFHRSNIKTAAAAPFFDGASQDPETFLRQRDAALAAFSAPDYPNLVPGAVVAADFALSDAGLRALKPFALGASGYLLIDLPPQKITPTLCERLSRLRIVSGLCPVAVDIDRCYSVWTPEDWLALRQAGVLLQVSIDGLLQMERRKLTLFLLANRYAHFVATGGREIEKPLRFVEAFRVLQRSLPAEIYRRVKNNSGMLLSNAEPEVFFSA